MSLAHVSGSVATLPVSTETILSIPWMSSKRVAHAMREVSQRGPHKKEVWQQLIGRVDMIAHSLSAKECALVFSAMAKSRDVLATNCGREYQMFTNRFLDKFWSRVMSTANAVDLAQIAYAFGKLGKGESILSKEFLERLAEGISTMDAPTLSLAAGGVSAAVGGDSIVAEKIVIRTVQLLESEFNEQLLVRCLVMAQRHRICVTPLFGHLTGRISSMSFRCFVAVVSSLGRSENREAVLRIGDPIKNSVSERIMKSTELTHKTSIKQLAVLLRSVQKMDRCNFEVIHKLIDLLAKRNYINMPDPSTTLGVLLAALSQARGSHVLAERIIRECNLVDIIMDFPVTERASIQASLQRLVDHALAEHSIDEDLAGSVPDSIPCILGCLNTLIAR